MYQGSQPENTREKEKRKGVREPPLKVKYRSGGEGVALTAGCLVDTQTILNTPRQWATSANPVKTAKHPLPVLIAVSTDRGPGPLCIPAFHHSQGPCV